MNISTSSFNRIEHILETMQIRMKNHLAMINTHTIHKEIINVVLNAQTIIL